MSDTAPGGAGAGKTAGTPASSRPVTVLLVDDQPIVAHAVRTMLAGESDIRFHYCQDPTRAIETANEVQPTIILQDLVMPDVDGLMLVKFFRANPATRQVPMIVLSSKEEPVIKAQAFALGANDYLVKPGEKIELIARIRYHSKSYIAQLERDEAYRELAERERVMAEELAQAARYVQSLLPTPLTGDIAIDWRFVPSTRLAGDIFGYHWLDADRLMVYLLDVSGHGVGSALLAVTVANVLAAKSLPATDFARPGQVVAKLNDLFPMEKQNEKYFTMWYGVYHKGTRSLIYANGGHPAPLLFGAAPSADSPLRLKATGPAVGQIGGIDYDEETVTLADRARLLIFSDGVYEVGCADGSVWRYKDLLAYLTGAVGQDGGSILDRTLAHVRGLHGEPILEDDFSMMELTIPGRP